MNRQLHRIFGVWFVVNLLIVALLLHRWGAVEVRNNFSELACVTVWAGIWLGLSLWLFPWLGLSSRMDLLEHRNAAALPALSGALTAAALLYAGGSLGEGPDYWENIFSAALGLAGWLSLWVILELGAGVSRSITEERNLASGIRTGGWLLATGLVQARAVAGNWHSVTGTVHDWLHDGWPAVILCLLALPVERFTRPRRNCSNPAASYNGILPALLYVSLACTWLWHLGPWEGMPR